jgi:integrase
METDIEDVAIKKAKQFIEETVNGLEQLEHMSLGALIDRFMATRSAMGKATLNNDRWLAKTFRATFGRPLTVLAEKVTTGDLLAWLNTQAAARNWGSRSYNHARLWLMQIFRLAVAEKAIRPQDDPFRDKQLIRPRRKDPVRRFIPTPEQFEAIIEKVRVVGGPADFLAFLGLAGVGQAEARALTWEDIKGDKMQFVRQKTKRRFEVPIYSWLAPLMSKLMQEAGPARTGNVFGSVTNPNRVLDKACDRLGTRRFTPRGLRAMLIKRLYDNGVPVKRIAQWQGHCDGGKLILEVYTEVFSSGDAAAERADLARVGGSVSVEQLAFKVV